MRYRLHYYNRRSAHSIPRRPLHGCVSRPRRGKLLGGSLLVNSVASPVTRPVEYERKRDITPSAKTSRRVQPCFDTTCNKFRRVLTCNYSRAVES
ncbi:hypothetical protein J6590_001989 [Homalodisca vitripennis]|nr:hypothetical protein J6590_001989 [Homalodisca vitripennis]